MSAWEPLPELTETHDGLPAGDVQRLRRLLAYAYGGDSPAADEAIELILRDGYRRAEQ